MNTNNNLCIHNLLDKEQKYYKKIVCNKMYVEKLIIKYIFFYLYNFLYLYNLIYINIKNYKDKKE